MSDKPSMTINIDTHLVRYFNELFAGSETHYGITVLGPEPEPGAKRDSKSHTVKGNCFENMLLVSDHLNGKQGLGVAPLMDREYVRFAVIDIDIYEEALRKRIVKAIVDSNLPLFPILSKSGGLHLYVFFNDKEKAVDVRAALFEIAAVFALDYYGKQFNSNFDKTEIFPKQNIETSQNGSNWINLPYFDYRNTTRYLLDTDCKPVLDALDAFQRMTDGKTTLKDLKAIMAQMKGADGPPCLQHFRLFNDIGENEGRNNYFFSLGRYLKLSEDPDIENELILANSQLDAPLPDNEWRPTLQSAMTTDASYLCQKSPLCNVCNRKLCNTRPFGVGNTAVSNFSFGQLTIITSDPPVYHWVIDEQVFEFFDESEILDQHFFQKMAVRKLHKAPIILKQDVWIKIVNNALSNKIIQTPDEGFGDSVGEILMAGVTEWLMNRAKTPEITLVAHGGAWHDTQRNRILFRMDNLHRHLTNNNIRFFNISQLQTKLSTKYGAQAERRSINGAQIRCWSIPISSLAPWFKDEGKDVDFEAIAAKELEGAEM